jgi:UDP-galactose 4-epimerase (EC 5.1.3.2)
VMDLARAHIQAVDHLGKPGHEIYNVGTGSGSSVFEVVNEIKRVSGVDFEVKVSDRRPGDPPKLIASSEK